MLADYNQNAWGRTLASIYSVRFTPLATVSAPVSWAEVERGFRVQDFRLDNMPARVREVGDLWKPLTRRAGVSPWNGGYESRSDGSAGGTHAARRTQWQYEPKWDGFRCLARREGDEIELQSKAGQPLARYFPDIIEALARLSPRRFILDSELVIPVGGNLLFNDLQLRLHPAASRVRKLAAEHPAMYLVFDLLSDERGSSLSGKPLRERRCRLEAFAEKYFEPSSAFRLSPATNDLQAARRWLRTMGGGLDGIIAKDLEARYEAGLRTGAIQKIKDLRTADCVVGGFRYAAKQPLVGSLLLGLYGDDGLLHHVGFTSSIPADQKRSLTKKLEALRKAPGFTGRSRADPSRWSTERSGEFEPLEAKLVIEVQYDHFTGGRFRHATKLLRWRPDKDPRQCTMAQVEHESRSPLGLRATPPKFVAILPLAPASASFHAVADCIIMGCQEGEPCRTRASIL